MWRGRERRGHQVAQHRRRHRHCGAARRGRPRGGCRTRDAQHPCAGGPRCCAICGGLTAGDADLAWAESILGSVGSVVRVPESQLDAVTGLAGSGPAYLFLVAEALIDAGVLAGLSRANSEALVGQLFVGSAALLQQRGDPAQLRAMVTSPGGTTAAGVRALEEHAVRSAFLEAVMAATARSAELGKH